MTGNTSIDHERQIVVHTSSGPQIAYEVMPIVLECLRLAREHHIHRFLIDQTSAKVQDSMGTSYQFINELPDLGVKKNDHIAIVDAANVPEEKERMEFTVNAAKNIGLNIMLFHDRNNAINWLMAH